MGMSREEVKAMDVILEGHHIGQERLRKQPDRLPNVDTVDYGVQTLEDAFPDNVVANFRPLGARLLVQMRRPQHRSAGGIELLGSTKEDIKWNQQIARVVRMGPLCFRNRETGEPWPESDWVKVGDFVRVPRWNGDRIVVDAPDGSMPVTFVCFNDYELIGVVEGDPLAMKVYIL
jgi:co-chaperonin GroES (HSP10)